MDNLLGILASILVLESTRCSIDTAQSWDTVYTKHQTERMYTCMALLIQLTIRMSHTFHFKSTLHLNPISAQPQLL